MVTRDAHVAGGGASGVCGGDREGVRGEGECRDCFRIVRGCADCAGGLRAGREGGGGGARPRSPEMRTAGGGERGGFWEAEGEEACCGRGFGGEGAVEVAFEDLEVEE